ncbi:hypothetical protein K1X84_04870 [bacterium]|nr:hypothetical protein [bacterium]
MNDSIPCPNGTLNCDSSSTVDTAKTRLKGVTGFTAFDINNRNNSSDIRLFFSLLDNVNFIKELRLILVKSDSASLFDQDDAESNVFFSLITPIQQDIKKTLPSTLVDSDGDSIVNGVAYSAFIYLVGKDTTVVDVLSVSSNSLLLSDQSLQDMYVSSRGTNAVILFDGVTGEYIRDFVPNGSGGLNLTQDVLFGDDGNLLVSGRGNSAIKKYNSSTGDYIGNFTSGYTLDQPTKISLSPTGTLLVSQWGTIKTGVAEFDASTGVFIREIIPALNLGMDHVWDADSNLYVVSYGSQDVRKYDTSGNFLNVLISSGLQGPVNLWFNNDFSILYIVNWTNGTVGKYMPSGTFISTFISGLNTVEGFAFDDAGHLYLCEWGSNRIKQYDYATGNFIKIFSTGHVVQPNSIAFGPNVDP